VKALVVVAFALLSSPQVRHDDPRVAAPPVVAATPVFDPEGFIADCTALSDAWRQYQQLERQLDQVVNAGK
jgi:hypothetical protein